MLLTFMNFKKLGTIRQRVSHFKQFLFNVVLFSFSFGGKYLKASFVLYKCVGHCTLRYLSTLNGNCKFIKRTKPWEARLCNIFIGLYLIGNIAQAIKFSRKLNHFYRFVNLQMCCYINNTCIPEYSSLLFLKSMIGR